MKPDYDMLFGNFFDDYRISDARFFSFADNALNNFIGANTNHQYDSTIAMLTPLVAAFGSEQGDVAFALTKQKGNTDTTDTLMEEITATMRAKMDEIAYKLGGKGTPAFLLFYPHGLTQYTQATKTAMPVIADQLSKAATQYSTQLGAELTAILTGFSTRWKTTRDSQQQQMGSVDSNRSERTKARRSLELGLLKAIYSVALSDVGNVGLGKNLFKFELLFGQTHHAHQRFAANVGIDETTVVANLMLPKSAVIHVSNTGTNAPFVVYCGATINTAPPDNAVIVNPGEHRDCTPQQLGNSAQQPYILVKNTSLVNDGSYEAEIVG